MDTPPASTTPAHNAQARKPTKPYPTFPLTPHARGGWVKRYKGRVYSIPCPNPKQALERWHQMARDIDAGLPLRATEPPEVARVSSIFDRYMTERTGHVAPATLRDYRDAANDALDCWGDNKAVTDLKPDHFTRLARIWGKRMGSHAMGRNIQAIRTMFKYAANQNWIDAQPRYGVVFVKPLTTRKQGKPFTVSEAARIVACAVGRDYLEPCLLMMLNGGFTTRDCSELPISAVDLDKALIIFPRPKMARRRPIDRVVTLWPETVEALREWMTTHAPGPGGRVFVTREGSPVGDGNALGQLFERLLKDMVMEHRGSSWLRHLHATLANELEKPAAKSRLMGHRLAGLDEVYVDAVEHERIKFVTDHLRRRLWFGASATSTPAPAAAGADDSSRKAGRSRRAGKAGA